MIRVLFCMVERDCDLMKSGVGFLATRVAVYIVVRQYTLFSNKLHIHSLVREFHRGLFCYMFHQIICERDVKLNKSLPFSHSTVLFLYGESRLLSIGDRDRVWDTLGIASIHLSSVSSGPPKILALSI